MSHGCVTLIAAFSEQYTRAACKETIDWCAASVRCAHAIDDGHSVAWFCDQAAMTLRIFWEVTYFSYPLEMIARVNRSEGYDWGWSHGGSVNLIVAVNVVLEHDSGERI